ALAAGASLHTGTRVERLDVAPLRVRVTVRGEAPREARAVVLACGANYRFNRMLGLGLPSAYVQSAQIEVPFPVFPHIDVRLGRTVAPGGFAWGVPFNRGDVSHARVGVLCDTDARGRFKDT